jgi:methyl-accepting chemotaxis protein
MNRLDQVLQTAGPLLRRVDEVVSGVGAPADHRMWEQLRRVRLLPADAVTAVASLRPAELTEAVQELRADARTYAGVAGSLPRPGAWSGAAAESYDEARRRLAEQIGGGPESFEERLDATADLAEALHEWMHHTQDDLAAILAEILGSAQALDLPVESATDPATTRAVLAAADIAERVLHQVADSYDQAADLLDASRDLTTTGGGRGRH